MLHPAWHVTWCTLSKLNKPGNNIQPWHTPFPIWNQSVPCPVLTVDSWPTYRFLKRKVRWFGILISWRIFQFVVIHTVKDFGIVNKADVFLELYDPMDIGNSISDSSAWASGSSWFTYYWSLAWRILSITLLACVESYGSDGKASARNTGDLG